jgi:hypothetical protein
MNTLAMTPLHVMAGPGSVADEDSIDRKVMFHAVVMCARDKCQTYISLNAKSILEAQELEADGMIGLATQQR